MGKARLVRISETDAGTFGMLVTDGGWWYALELPWRQNRRNVSRIPSGEYGCEWTYSPTFRKHLYLVSPVRNRSGIRIHAGNWAGDAAKGLRTHVQGCILLGQRTGLLQGQPAVLGSQDALTQFEEVMGRRPFQLTIQIGL